MRIEDLEFELPSELIAQFPTERREQARLMVVDRTAQRIAHHHVWDLPSLLRPGDLLVRNNTRVIPARLLGHREATRGKWEGLFLRSRPEGRWEILATTRGHPQPGERITIGEGLHLTLEGRGEGGSWLVRPSEPGDAYELLEQHGQIPLPPYIRKGREGPGDRQRYQTTYAREAGSVAAPTAGLHLSAALFEALRDRGIEWTDVTLHVGIGTFRPIQADRLEDHVLHAEWARLTEPVANQIQATRQRGGRIVAVGTTTARTLETAARNGTMEPFHGETDLFIRPGHTFHGLDALMTNFHLPRSSLLALVAALAGLDLIRAAYREAIDQRYRFYSYGDAMLILS